MRSLLLFPIALRRVPGVRLAHRAATAAALLTLLAGSGACANDGTSPASRRAYGVAQSLGQGVARTFVTLDNSGQVVSLGVALSEPALSGLPQTPMPGMPAAAMLTLALPAEAAGTGYDHVMLDWNPAGHEPEHVYTHPHFDFHFYQISPAERDQMNPGNPDFGTKSGIFPTAAFVPTGFAPASTLAGIPAADAAVPLMGMHWLDTSSPELQLPPNNHTFTRTFIYGSYDGTFTFVEPMITKAFIESTKATSAGFSFPVAVPTQVAKSAAYPARYSITYDAGAREYRISLDDLVYKQGAP